MNKADIALPKGQVFSQAFIKKIISSARIGIWDWDLVTDEFTINEEWASIIGHDAETLPKAGKAWRESVYPDDAEMLNQNIEKYLSGKTDTYSIEYRIVKKGGDSIWVHETGFISESDTSGRPIRFSGTLQDVTKTVNQRIETKTAAQESTIAKNAFLSTISHEIRTPMNSIIGFSDLALDNDISPRTREYLKKIKYSSEGLLQIIDDILDIAKIEAGKMKLDAVPFEMHEVFRVCRDIITPKALEKGIMFFCYAEPSIGERLIGDPLRLKQVLLSLLSNAVKFTNSGVVKLMTDIDSTTQNSVTIRFEVKDSGIGMTAEQIEKIFDPFTQADSSMTRQYGGTGLGLSITRNIVEMMGGKLEVASVPGIGSKFCFTLTFTTISKPDNQNQNEESDPKMEKPVLIGDVLVCEDSLMNQQVIREHLVKIGLNATIVPNGKEGVDLVKRRMDEGMKPYDLILMDVYMPVMDGLEATKQLALVGNKTPIVALTTNVMVSDQEIYRAHGMQDYVAKPIRPQELWKCLLKYIAPVGMETVKLEPREREPRVLDKAKAGELAIKLEPLLMADNTKSLEFTEELREMPGTDELIRQIEDYDFEMALETFGHIRKSWGV